MRICVGVIRDHLRDEVGAPLAYKFDRRDLAERLQLRFNRQHCADEVCVAGDFDTIEFVEATFGEEGSRARDVGRKLEIVLCNLLDREKRRLRDPAWMTPPKSGDPLYCASTNCVSH